jgi:DNA-binding winged helix-turn-helix (wHTH) protein
VENLCRTHKNIGTSFAKASLGASGHYYFTFAATLTRMQDWSENSVLKSGDLTIYPRTGQVEIQGQIVKLGLVNMRVLLMLLAHAGEVVSRSELFEYVWKNQTVSDESLTRCISELRTLLGENSSHPQLIETLPKRGYRWLLTVDTECDQAAAAASPGSGVVHGRWKRVLSMVSFVLASLVLFTVLVLWWLDSSLKPEPEKMVLIPVYTSQPAQRSLAADLDDMLREQLLATENLRFLRPQCSL